LNNFYTILVIPEKTKQVKKLVVPAIYVRVGLVLGAVAVFFVAFMVYDYVNVMRQLAENKRLQTDNRQLKQQVQTFTTKLQSVQDALDRIQSYTTKLRIITNQAGDNSEGLKKRVAPNIQGEPMDDHSDLPSQKKIPDGRSGKAEDLLPRDWKNFTKVADASSAASPANPSAASALVEALEKAKDAPSQKVRQTPRRLSDLIREDEEKESAEIRGESETLNKAFDSVLQHAQSVEMDVQSLTTALYDQRDFLNSMPTLKPTNGWYSSGFGIRNSPFTTKITMHEGMDIANHMGSTIISPAAGVVTYAGARSGYGNLVTIDHGYGIQTQFGHISRWYVKVGEKVKRGQKIAAVGNAGRSTGPHVHYEVRVNGIPVDPYFYILED
jgi:murein DD-endopeptidase MepM/ murein hydrolase activator NlpD